MLRIITVPIPAEWPIDGAVENLKIGRYSVSEIISRIFTFSLNNIYVRGDFIPSPETAELLMSEKPVKIISPDNNQIMCGNSDGPAEIYPPDNKSFQLQYPWDLLKLNEIFLENIQCDIQGEIHENTFISGNIQLGRNSIILPGVVIEGNTIIGENCKIGPNCYIRGKTSIGNNCHIGQAVEIKNSILGDHVNIGHLSYAGDSIISSHVNFGAGTIISNLRHDGKNHNFMLGEKLVSTSRRKFGAFIGKHVHTGIHTSIYPGRSLSSFSTTLPGETVKYSK